MACDYDKYDWEEEVRYLDERPLVVSVSGGKDSTAACLKLKELGLHFTAVHMDTGWEHPETEAYVREYLPEALDMEIKVLKPKLRMKELILRKNMFPSHNTRYCTQKLKMDVIAKFLKGLPHSWDQPVNVTGIRAEESTRRSEYPRWEWQDRFDCEVWRPILHFDLQDVIDIHLKHGVEPNPLYLRDGVGRVGCWPCIYAKKADVRALMTPERVEEIAKLEEQVTGTFFYRGKKRLPAAKIMEWANSPGRDHDTPDTGCMRWGLCS